MRGGGQRKGTPVVVYVGCCVVVIMGVWLAAWVYMGFRVMRVLCV